MLRHIFLATLLLAPALSRSFPNCKCWKGYVPEVQEDGNPACVGVYLLHIMDCNVPQPPRCLCTGATGILMDKDGTFCSKFSRGREVQRWPCENRKEWEEYQKESLKEY